MKSSRVHSNVQPGLRITGTERRQVGEGLGVSVREEKGTFPERTTPLPARSHGGVLTPAALSKGRQLGSVAFTSSTRSQGQVRQPPALGGARLGPWVCSNRPALGVGLNRAPLASPLPRDAFHNRVPGAACGLRVRALVDKGFVTFPTLLPPSGDYTTSDLPLVTRGRMGDHVYFGANFLYTC